MAILTNSTVKSNAFLKKNRFLQNLFLFEKKVRKMARLSSLFFGFRI